MLRTRDFVLLFSAIMFLVLAIGTTLLKQGNTPSEITGFVIPDDSVATPTAKIIAREELNREQRIAQMRSKISQQALISETIATKVDDEEPVESESSSATAADVAQSGPLLCSQYRPYTSFWDARDVQVVASEGALVVVRDGVGSSSVPTPVLQLPTRTTPSTNPTCLASDVIGIATDGSLIRNNEVGLYSIFGADTLIGYALDGFPIYGAGVGAVDACGGVVVSGVYRYQIQLKNETIINCFAGTPVSLP